MVQLNYFKPIEELSKDFEQLTIGGQNRELNTLLDRYLKHSREDFKLIGQNSSQTKNIWNVYEHLKEIQIKRIEALAEKEAEPKAE